MASLATSFGGNQVQLQGLVAGRGPGPAVSLQVAQDDRAGHLGGDGVVRGEEAVAAAGHEAVGSADADVDLGPRRDVGEVDGTHFGVEVLLPGNMLRVEGDGAEEAGQLGAGEGGVQVQVAVLVPGQQALSLLAGGG